MAQPRAAPDRRGHRTGTRSSADRRGHPVGQPGQQPGACAIRRCRPPNCSRDSATASTTSTTTRSLPTSPTTSLLYWALLAMTIVRTGRRTFGPSFDRTRLDNLTLGLDRHATRNLHRLPMAITRLSRLRKVTERFYRDYDVLLTPTLADETPRIGHLDPTADYQQVIDRLVDWVGVHAPAERDRGARDLAATGRVRLGHAGRHDVGCADRATTAGCWSWPTNSRPPNRSRKSRRLCGPKLVSPVPPESAGTRAAVSR